MPLCEITHTRAIILVCFAAESFYTIYMFYTAKTNPCVTVTDYMIGGKALIPPRGFCYTVRHASMFLQREAALLSSGKPICVGLPSGSFALLF